MALQVEVSFSGFPFVAGLGQQGADQAQQRGFVRKETGDARAAFEFHIDPFEGGGGVSGDDFLGAAFGAGPIGTVEDAADDGGHGGVLVQSRHKGLGVWLQMKLTTLPGDRRKEGGPRRPQTGVVVAGDELQAVESAFLQAGQKGAPMHFGFAEGGAGGRDDARTYEKKIRAMVKASCHSFGGDIFEATQPRRN